MRLKVRRENRMNEREELIWYVLRHPELTDRLEEIALSIEKQTPDHRNN